MAQVNIHIFDLTLSRHTVVDIITLLLLVAVSIYLYRRIMAASSASSEEKSEGECEHTARLEALDAALANLEARVQQLERNGGTSNTPEEKKPGIKSGQQTPRHAAEKRADSRLDSAEVQNFCRLYNSGVDDSSRRQEFRELYAPIRIRTANAMERRRDLKVEPKFQTASDGDFYVVRLQELGNSQYLVVPRFDLTFEESSYGPGAMGVVFQCPNYDAQSRYSHVKLERPAIFKPDGEQTWKLHLKGLLNLGEGD
jgi:hypothetical protein